MKKNSLIKIIIALALAIFIFSIIMLILQPFSDEGETGGEVTYATTVTEATETVETTSTYVSPIDWDSLWAKNEDIYACIDIVGTDMQFPVVQHETDDTFYLTHNAYKEEYKAGAIMSEKAYNSKTFDDPVTILYGHKMRSGEMFGTLQQTYSDEEGFENHREIVIYLPDKELHYKVWAAVPYSNTHIMYTYEKFSNCRKVQRFVNEINEIRTVEVQRDETMEVDMNDKLLVLSTCLMGHVKNRYLVVARLEAEN